MKKAQDGLSRFYETDEQERRDVMKVQSNHKLSHIVGMTLAALLAFTVAVKGVNLRLW